MDEIERLKQEVERLNWENGIMRNHDCLAEDAERDEQRDAAIAERDALAERVKTLDAALLRFFNEGQGLGGSHPHLAAYVAHDKSVWEQGRAALGHDNI